MNRIVFLFLFVAQCVFGQFFVIKDKDGYSNIREKANAKSKIVGTFPNGTLFYFPHADDSLEPWWQLKEGYIHRSRFKDVSTFPAISRGKRGENSISFAGMGISVVITVQKFDKQKHKIVRENRGDYYEYVIDGVKAEGIDDFLPTSEYKSIEVTINGKKVEMPQDAYRGVFEVTTYEDNNFVYYDKEDDIIYIVGNNGDGANGYDICWQIVKGVYKTKEIGYFN